MHPIRRRSALVIFATAALAGPHAFAAPGRTNSEDDGSYSVPNMFISPCGEPFRAAFGAPYPVADWFHRADKDANGKLDHGEFLADAEAFFKKLDVNHDGVITHTEVRIYETSLVPEIIGGRVRVGLNGVPRLILAQYGSASGALNGMNMSIDPSGHDNDLRPKPKVGLNVSGEGAAPYGFFEEPEPIMTADFNVNGIITKENFLKVADMHFTALDQGERGFLSLDALPLTAVEKLLNGKRGRRRS
jgi:hypothetical protein